MNVIPLLLKVYRRNVCFSSFLFCNIGILYYENMARNLNKMDQEHDTQYNPANTNHLYDIYTMLVQRRRRWAGVV